MLCILRLKIIYNKIASNYLQIRCWISVNLIFGLIRLLNMAAAISYKIVSLNSIYSINRLFVNSTD